MEQIRKHSGTLVILLVCAAVCAGLWAQSGVINTRAGGDSPFLLIRAQQLAQNVNDGALPARWMPDAAFGLGYPFFNYYASLPYYLIALLSISSVGLLAAIKLTQTLAIVAAAFAMRGLAQRLLPGMNSGAVLAAIAYTVAPFHLANIYTRGDSLSELWAFVWFPLILSAIYDITTGLRARPFGALAGLTLSLAALVVTHNVSALLFAPFIVLWSVALLWRASRASPRGAVRASGLLLVSASLAVGLSAWFWLPALSEAAQAQLGEQTTGYFNYANHFRQLGVCALSLNTDLCNTRASDQISLVRGALFGGPEAPGVFSMHLTQVLFLVLGAAVWATSRARLHMLGLIGGLALLATILITPLAAPVWAALKPLQLAQFPWRMLSVQSVFVSLLIGGALARGAWPLARAVLIGAILLLTALPQTAARNLAVQADDINPRTIQLFEWYSGIIGTTIRAEYLPVSALPVPATGPDLLGHERSALIAEDGVDASALTSQLVLLESVQQRWRININTTTLRLTLPLIYTPAWTARDANSGASIALSAYAGSGWAMLTLPQGAHDIVLEHTGTAMQTLGERISLLSALPLLVLLALVARAQTRDSWRRFGVFAAGTLLLMFALVIGDRLQNRKAYQAVQAEWVNFGETPFVNRGIKEITNPTVSEREPTVYRLLGARVEPRRLRAGDTFTLTLDWERDAAPLTLTLETPIGSDRFDFFRMRREQAAIDTRVSMHVVPSDTLAGPLLLALTPRTPFHTFENGASVAGKTVPGFTLIGPTVTETRPNAPKAQLGAFANGIRMHGLDWLRQNSDGVCFRAQWSRAGAVNRADALQVSFKLYGADNRLVAQADGQPLAGLAPTWSWQDNVVINDSQCVLVRDANAQLAQGEAYRLEISWYRLATGDVTGQVERAGVADMREGALNEPR